MYSVQAVLQCLSPALVVICKPIGILYEMAMGLDVTGDGGGYSPCKSISAAKSSNTIGVDLVMRACCFKRGGVEKVDGEKREG